jgi:EAL domain-containing protein (putative c-di-GMP-specific phosphodiesterase class I)
VTPPNEMLVRDPAPASRAPALERAEFLQFLSEQIAARPEGITAVLILETRYIDRLHAMVQGPPPQTVVDRIHERLANALRDVDRFARLSDEQVCIVLPGLAAAAQPILAAVKILRALEGPLSVSEAGVPMRAHIGIAAYPEHARDGPELLMCADIARRVAATREEGYHIFLPEDRAETEMYRGLDVQLEQAIRANELEVHYQPQIHLRDSRCEAVEALLRWKGPDGNGISPTTLVGIAENTGLIGPLTIWVLNAVLRQAQAFNREGVELRFSVNLSTRTLVDQELPDVIAQSLRTWDVPAAQLTLEITESSVIGDAEQSIDMLNKLKALGVDLSIDDFGTGYSSLAYLKRFPVDELKIDKMFVMGMMKDRGDRQITRSVIDLAHNFELRAVAEGVEDDATMQELKRLGCDIAQGFQISRAIPARDLGAWLRESPYAAG